MNNKKTQKWLKGAVINRFCDCGKERGARYGKDNNQCSRCQKPLCCVNNPPKRN